MSRHVARIPLHLFVRFLAQPACGTHTVWRLIEVRPYETTCLVCHGNVVVGLCRLRARIHQCQCTLQFSYGGSLVTNVGSVGGTRQWKKFEDSSRKSGSKKNLCRPLAAKPEVGVVKWRHHQVGVVGHDPYLMMTSLDHVHFRTCGGVRLVNVWRRQDVRGRRHLRSKKSRSAPVTGCTKTFANITHATCENTTTDSFNKVLYTIFSLHLNFANFLRRNFTAF